jgi:hypothetical protein
VFGLAGFRGLWQRNSGSLAGNGNQTAAHGEREQREPPDWRREAAPEGL